MPKKKMGRSPLAKVPTPRISSKFNDTRLAYSMRELADGFDVSEKTIYNRIKDGQIRSFKLGNLTRISAVEVARLLGGDAS
jgi:excisionase family DNA binding protein